MTNHVVDKFSNRGGWSLRLMSWPVKNQNILVDYSKTYRTRTSNHPTQPPPTPH